MPEKIKLDGGPKQTVTWIWLEQGQRKVEFYDFSETAQRMFGNDIAYTITIDEMEKLFSKAAHDQKVILVWMAENFLSYFAIKKWLEENEINFNVKRESWA